MNGVSGANMLSGQTLLLTGTAPGEAGVGGVILQDLLQVVGPESVTCVWLAPRNATTPTTIPGLTLHRLVRRYETAWRPVRGLFGELLSLVASAALRRSMLGRLENECLQILESGAFDRVVSVLESRASIDLSYRLQTRTELPWRSIVWDDVQLFAQQSVLDRWSSARLFRRFECVLQRSEDVAVICENMQSTYRDHYGVDSFVLRHGISDKYLPLGGSSRNGQQSARPFMIGFAGSITAPDCFEQLVRTLDAMHWVVGERPIVLRILGARYMMYSTVPQRIDYYGWRSPDDTQAILSECDLMYLPQTFSASLEFFSRLSFPTKLSTYIATGRPILLHAPDYASLSTFWRDHPMGPVVHQLSVDELRVAISEVAGSGLEDRVQWQAASRFVGCGALGAEQFKSGARRILSEKLTAKR